MGHHRPASDTPSQWHFAGRADDGLFIAVFGSSIPLSTKKAYQNCTPSEKKPFYIRACWINISHVWLKLLTKDGACHVPGKYSTRGWNFSFLHWQGHCGLFLSHCLKPFLSEHKTLIQKRENGFHSAHVNKLSRWHVRNELTACLSWTNVGERNFLHEQRAYLISAKVKCFFFVYWP